jgi:hypothetical protein
MNTKKRFIKLIFIAFTFLCVFSISCSTVSSSQTSPVNIPSDFFGLIDGYGRPEEYALLDEMGAEWLILTCYWSRIESEKGVYNFSYYDDFVDNAKAYNKKVAGILGYGSPWISDSKNNSYVSKENLHHFLDFVEAAVSRYKGRVDAWQIWNEPNGLFWKGSKKDFFELTKQTALKIREIDPDVCIIGGGFLMLPKRYIISMNRAGAMENLDAISYHPYAANPNGSIRQIDNFNKILSKINFQGDSWITEVGFPTSGIYPSRVSLKNFPAYVVKTITGAAVRGIRTLIWYQFTDPHKLGEFPNRHNSEMYFGLVYYDQTRKDGAWAYELCAQYLPGTQYDPALPLRENIGFNIASFCFIGNESETNTLIIWNNRNSRQKIKIDLSSPMTVHDISTGNYSSLPNEAVLEVTNQPIFITWQGDLIPHLSRPTTSP